MKKERENLFIYSAATLVTIFSAGYFLGENYPFYMFFLYALVGLCAIAFFILTINSCVILIRKKDKVLGWSALISWVALALASLSGFLIGWFSV